MYSSEKQEGTWIQCTECGAIYWIDQEVPIDRLYVASYCKKCENEKGVNLGSDKDHIYEFMDINIDPRFYKY